MRSPPQDAWYIVYFIFLLQVCPLWVLFIVQQARALHGGTFPAPSDASTGREECTWQGRVRNSGSAWKRKSKMRQVAIVSPYTLFNVPWEDCGEIVLFNSASLNYRDTLCFSDGELHRHADLVERENNWRRHPSQVGWPQCCLGQSRVISAAACQL